MHHKPQTLRGARTLAFWSSFTRRGSRCISNRVKPGTSTYSSHFDTGLNTDSCSAPSASDGGGFGSIGGCLLLMITVGGGVMGMWKSFGQLGINIRMSGNVQFPEARMQVRATNATERVDDCIHLNIKRVMWTKINLPKVSSCPPVYERRNEKHAKDHCYTGHAREKTSELAGRLLWLPNWAIGSELQFQLNWSKYPNCCWSLLHTFTSVTSFISRRKYIDCYVITSRTRSWPLSALSDLFLLHITSW